MKTIAIFCLLSFGIIVSFHLLCSIATYTPTINHYESYGYTKVNNDVASVRINSYIDDHRYYIDDINKKHHQDDSNDTATDKNRGDITNGYDLHQVSNNSNDEHNRNASLVSAMFVFGDSTVDVGNNNHLITVSRSNFPPYGRDLMTKKPSGRFCNGKLVIDYIASMVNLQPRLVPYLDILDDLERGQNVPLQLEVSFASACSGFYKSTATHFNALPLQKQLDHFKEYRQKLIVERGLENSLDILGRAIFIISTGTNDLLNNYYLNPYLRSRYSLFQFQNLLLDICSQFIKDIYELGARKIGVVSLPPFGCLPAIRTLHRKGAKDGCVLHLNQHALAFNHMLQSTTFPSLQTNLGGGLHLAYMDSHTVLLDVLENPTSYGFKQAHKACCGSGKLEVGIFCNKLSIGTCEDATNYVFWDSFHPTDQMNMILATKLMEQIWKAFEIDEPNFIHNKPTSIESMVQYNEEKPKHLVRKWRWKIFVLGSLLYVVHLLKQFFPKIIDLGV